MTRDEVIRACVVDLREKIDLLVRAATPKGAAPDLMKALASVDELLDELDEETRDPYDFANGDLASTSTWESTIPRRRAGSK